MQGLLRQMRNGALPGSCFGGFNRLHSWWSGTLIIYLNYIILVAPECWTHMYLELTVLPRDMMFNQQSVYWNISFIHIHRPRESRRIQKHCPEYVALEIGSTTFLMWCKDPIRLNRTFSLIVIRLHFEVYSLKIGHEWVPFCSTWSPSKHLYTNYYNAWWVKITPCRNPEIPTFI